MKGRIALGADVYEGARVHAAGVRVEFTVEGTITSFDRFAEDRIVELAGSVTSDLFGGRMVVEDGTLHLFAKTSSPQTSELVYRLPFVDAFGQRYELSGFKTICDDRGLDLWRDTSLLFVSLDKCSDRPPTRIARGTMRISVVGFLVLFLTMRVGARAPKCRAREFDRSKPRRMSDLDAGACSVRRHISLRGQFVVWFLRQLAKVYGNPFVVNAGEDQVTALHVGRELQKRLAFTPRPMVRWADPLVLWRTAIRVRRSTALDASLDQRESQPADVQSFDELAAESEAWVDFIADTGDGFLATYSVAYSAAQATLNVGGCTTPRGRALILGGDLVYPTPSRADYGNRLRGPFAAALPQDEKNEHVVLAIPGNHDWYDNLKSFAHYFMSPRQRLGGRRVVQHQSYFAMRLPASWWILGVDAALDTHLNAKQLAFFEGDREFDQTGAPGRAGRRQARMAQRRRLQRLEEPSLRRTHGGGKGILATRHHGRCPPLRALRRRPGRADAIDVWGWWCVHVWNPSPSSHPGSRVVHRVRP